MLIKKILKWFGIFLGGVLGIALIAAIIINVIIATDLGKTFEIQGTAIDIPESEAMIAEGSRLAKLRGCNGGCHGDGSRGRVFFEIPGGSRIVAPNVVWAAQNYPIEDLERLIRHGVRPDGTSLLMLMPSTMLYHLSDEDLGAIVAFLRSQEAGDDELEVTHLNAIGRLMIFYFKQLAGALLAADVIDHQAERLNPHSHNEIERGQYLAKTVCSECHGDDLRGSPAFGMPDLVVAMAYKLEDFRTLLRTGKPSDERELGLMAEVSNSRFTHFTDDEIDDLHAFLQTLSSTASTP